LQKRRAGKDCSQTGEAKTKSRASWTVAETSRGFNGWQIGGTNEKNKRGTVPRRWRKCTRQGIGGHEKKDIKNVHKRKKTNEVEKMDLLTEGESSCDQGNDVDVEAKYAVWLQSRMNEK